MFAQQTLQQQAIGPVARAAEVSATNRAAGPTAVGTATPAVAVDRVSSIADSAVAQQLATLVQAQRASNRAVSMAQTADGGLQEVGSLLARMRELAVQATSETLTPAQRTDVDAAYQTLAARAQVVVRETRYEGESLLDDGTPEPRTAEAIGPTRVDASITVRRVGETDIRSHWASSRALIAIDRAIADVGNMRTHLRSSFSLQGPTIRTLQQQVDLAGADATTVDTAYAIATNALVSVHIQQNAARLVAMVANQMPAAALALLYFDGAANGGR